MDEKTVSRSTLAGFLGMSVQGVGMVITGKVAALSTENHSRAADYLHVNHLWLATGEGEMVSSGEPTVKHSVDGITPQALELATLFDLIPPADKIKRHRAFNQAAASILSVLPDDSAK